MATTIPQPITNPLPHFTAIGVSYEDLIRMQNDRELHEAVQQLQQTINQLIAYIQENSL